MQPIIWDWPKEYRATMNSTFQLMPSNLSSTSPYTGQTTVYGPQVQRNEANLTFPGMLPPDWRTVQAIITRSRGTKGLLRIVDYHRMHPARDQFDRKIALQNWSDGTTWSDGTGWREGLLPPWVEIDEAAAEGAESFVVRGLPENVDRCIRMSDLMEVRPNGIPAPHGHLYDCISNARTNADGKTRIYVQPGLRKGVRAGDMLVLRYPTSVFSLKSDQEGIISRGLASIGQGGIALIEVVPWQ